MRDWAEVKVEIERCFGRQGHGWRLLKREEWLSDYNTRLNQRIGRRAQANRDGAAGIDRSQQRAEASKASKKKKQKQHQGS